VCHTACHLIVSDHQANAVPDALHDDIVPFSPPPRGVHHRFHATYVAEWGALFVGCSVSKDVKIVHFDDDARYWTIYEGARAPNPDGWLKRRRRSARVVRSKGREGARSNGRALQHANGCTLQHMRQGHLTTHAPHSLAHSPDPRTRSAPR
jgi:hypothetical protein